MLVFGAIDFAAALARMGTFLGYRVTVCDARPVFATPASFPDADEVVGALAAPVSAEQLQQGLLDERTVICVLTHDPKFDVPLLEVALRGPPVAYIGAMGSRRTHEDRLQRLREAGLTERGTVPAAQPGRAGPGRPHPGGNRRVHRGRDHRPAVGRQRPAAGQLGDRIHHDEAHEPQPQTAPSLQPGRSA